MLEGLDEIEWSKLHHACGLATDVPAYLRALYAPDKKERIEAVQNLHGSIIHQGSVYQATPYAVPFLVECISDADYPQLEDVLGLLAHLADRDCPDNNQHLSRREEEQETYDAVHDGIPFYVSHLSHPNPVVRTTASLVLSHFPDREHHLAPTVHARFVEECDAVVRAGILHCWGLISEMSPETIHEIVGYAADSEEALIVRFMAVMILERRFPTTFRATTAPVLWEALFDTGDLEDYYAQVVYFANDLYSAIMTILYEYAQSCPEVIQTGFAQLLTTIVQDGIEGGYRNCILDDFLSFAFPYLQQGSTEEYPFLSRFQNSLLHQLVEKEGIWQHNVAQSLKGRGLPTDRENLRQFLRERANTLSPQ